MAKNPPANAGDVGWIPGLGRSPGVGNSNPLQQLGFLPEESHGAWWAAMHGVTESDMTEP